MGIYDKSEIWSRITKKNYFFDRIFSKFSAQSAPETVSNAGPPSIDLIKIKSIGYTDFLKKADDCELFFLILKY